MTHAGVHGVDGPSVELGALDGAGVSAVGVCGVARTGRHEAVQLKGRRKAAAGGSGASKRRCGCEAYAGVRCVRGALPLLERAEMPEPAVGWGAGDVTSGGVGDRAVCTCAGVHQQAVAQGLLTNQQANLPTKIFSFWRLLSSQHLSLASAAAASHSVRGLTPNRKHTSLPFSASSV